LYSLAEVIHARAFNPLTALANMFLVLNPVVTFNYSPGTSSVPAPAIVVPGQPCKVGCQARSHEVQTRPLTKEIVVVRRPHVTIARQGSPICYDSQGFSISVQVLLEDDALQGAVPKSVTLTSDDDPASIHKIVADLASCHELTVDEQLALETDLLAQWEDARATASPTYAGPICEELVNCVASVETGVGLNLEVADSQAVVGDQGLFVRCLGAQSVTLAKGTAICGYADGEMRTAPDLEDGKSVAFVLSSLGDLVWFEKQLRTVGDLLMDESIDAIAGHKALYDEGSGNLTGVSVDEAYLGPRYFVPSSPQPTPLSVLTFGHISNDLVLSANGAPTFATGEEAEKREAMYEEASEISNVLALAFRLERDEQQPNVLVPSRPVCTLCRDIKFANEVPMELGCSYGARFWESKVLMETEGDAVRMPSLGSLRAGQSPRLRARSTGTLNADEEEKLMTECVQAGSQDVITMDEALTVDERAALMAYYNDNSGSLTMTQADSTDGLPQYQVDLPSPALRSLAKLVSPERIAEWWSTLHELPAAAIDDLEGDVPWDLEECSVHLRHYSATTRPDMKWHADEARYTINIALHGTDEGGQLMAMLGGKCGPIERGPGTAVFHSSNVAHCVDPVIAGERMTLIIFVHKSSGKELRERWFAGLQQDEDKQD